jgi:hypothetical protein
MLVIGSFIQNATPAGAHSPKWWLERKKEHAVDESHRSENLSFDAKRGIMEQSLSDLSAIA